MLTDFWKRLLSIPCAQENAHTIELYQPFGTTNKNQIQVRIAANHLTAAPLPIGTPLFYDQSGALKGKNPQIMESLLRANMALKQMEKILCFEYPISNGKM